MNNRRAMLFQALRGPVLLITIGTLFAIQQAGVASFGRTWPVLLIAIGLMKLLERSAGPATPYGNQAGNGMPYAPPPAPGNPNYPSGPGNTDGGVAR